MNECTIARCYSGSLVIFVYTAAEATATNPFPSLCPAFSGVQLTDKKTHEGIKKENMFRSSCFWAMLIIRPDHVDLFTFDAVEDIYFSDIVKHIIASSVRNLHESFGSFLFGEEQFRVNAANVCYQVLWYVA